MANKVDINGLYKHFKGGLYRVVYVSRNSNYCNMEYVTYRSLQKTDFPIGQLWTRPLNEFTGRHKSGVKRFVRVYE